MVILPTWAVQAGRATTQQLDEFGLLHKYRDTCVHLAPSGMDDDAFILAFAKSTNSLVLSNDLFRDHVSTGLVDRDWLAHHRVGFMWIESRLLTSCMPSGSDGSSPITTAGRKGKPTSVAVPTSPRARRIGSVTSQPIRSGIAKYPAAPVVRKTFGSPRPRQGSGPSMRNLLERNRA